MYRRELFKFILGAAVTFALVCAAGFLCVYFLKREVSLVVGDTLPGLINAGAANGLKEDNFLRSLMLSELKSPEEQNRCISEIEKASEQTESYLKKYAEAIFSETDRANYDALVRMRRSYVEARRQFIGLVREGRREDALAFFKGTVVPAYDRYNEAGAALFDFNVKEGEARSRRVEYLSYVTPIIVGIFGVVIFVAGALVGFRATLP